MMHALLATGSLLAASSAGINWHGFFFLLFALLACGLAVAVLLADNVVRMAFYLVLSLGATAGLFFLAGAEFVGAMQLMIYVGGTLVLLVFGVMLTAQTKLVALRTPPGDRVIAGILAAALNTILLQLMMMGYEGPYKELGRVLGYLIGDISGIVLFVIMLISIDAVRELRKDASKK